MTLSLQELAGKLAKNADGEPVSFNWTAPDGLVLSGDAWLPETWQDQTTETALPVLCLPGLSRNTRDFQEVANYLKQLGHPVFALDYRGRGKSAWDPDWNNYSLAVEAEDIDAAIEFLGLDRFAVLGTSRGGLHGLAMSYRYGADRMKAVIFNDIGPDVEMTGLKRIAGSLGHNMQHPALADIADKMASALGPQFPGFDDAHWQKLAGQLASRHDGRYVLDYDPQLARQLDNLEDATPMPDLWPLYDRLTDRPVLVLRGEHSDILSEATCQRMLDTHPNATVKTIEGQGHAPVLWEPETHEAIGKFLKDCAQ